QHHGPSHAWPADLRSCKEDRSRVDFGAGFFYGRGCLRGQMAGFIEGGCLWEERRLLVEPVQRNRAGRLRLVDIAGDPLGYITPGGNGVVSLGRIDRVEVFVQVPQPVQGRGPGDLAGVDIGGDSLGRRARGDSAVSLGRIDRIEVTPMRVEEPIQYR